MPLHIPTHALTAQDDWKAATDRLAAFSAHQVEDLVVDLDSGKLFGLMVGQDVLKASAKAVVARPDNVTHLTGVWKDV